jgi:hypothetical protein
LIAKRISKMIIAPGYNPETMQLSNAALAIALENET